MKRFLAVSFLSTGFLLSAQHIGNSPYAAFGVGDLKYDNSLDISSMGGVSTAFIWDFNNHFNFTNPANNANMELTNFSIEATNENGYFRSDYNDYKDAKHSTYLSNISFAFPISKKMKFGIGYQPYSSKNYKIITQTETTTDDANINIIESNLHTGKGNLSTAQAALSYNISKSFALGLRSNFYFGNIYDIEEVSYTEKNTDADGTITYDNSDLVNGYENKNRVKNFNFTLGTSYQKKLENDKKLTFGATYTFGNSGTMDYYYTNSTYFYSAGTQVDETIIEKDHTKNNNLIPESYSFGVGYGKDMKWFLGSQFDYTEGRTISYLGEPFTYDSSYKISAGGWWMPNQNNFRNYFARTLYRFGAYYKKGGLYAQASSASTGNYINEFAVTGGVSLPYASSNSAKRNAIDLGFELGQRGTLENDLVRQTFFNIKVGINFSDLWFKKRTFD